MTATRAWTLALALVLGHACSRPTPSASEPEHPPPGVAPEPVEVREGQVNLLFTFRDSDSGRFVTVESRDDVPEAVREAVVVVDLNLPPEARGANRYVHVADLRAARPNGTFPVAVASRHRFGNEASVGAEGAPAAPNKGVVLYSASWCGVCKKTSRLLREWGVPFEEKDIEASRSAREELGAKASRAGIRPGGVPVIDVGGVLLQGLDPERLQTALKEKGLLRG